jgi:hypothetical protein
VGLNEIESDRVARACRASVYGHAALRERFLDGDGLDDFRYLKTKSGCQIWPAQRWERDRERFTHGGPQLARANDAHGKKVPNCVMR